MARPRKVKALFANARRAQHRLSDWMRENYVELTEQLGRGRIDWRTPMAIFIRLGLTDEHGQRPSIDTVRRTWARVRSEVIKLEAEKLAKNPVPGPGEIALGVRVADTTDNSTSVQNLRRPSIDIRPARPPAETQTGAGRTEDAASPAEHVGTSDKPAPSRARAAIRNALETISVSRVSMPRRGS